MFELVFLIVGLAVLVAAAATLLIRRIPTAKDAEHIRPGLVETSDPLTIPADIRPGMVTALQTGESTTRDIKLTLLDLATRGLLTIEILSPSSGRATWKVIPEAPALYHQDLLSYEKECLAVLEQTGPIAIKDFLRHPDRPVHRVRKSLSEEVRTRPWFTSEPRPYHSPLALAGALVLAIGLVGTAFMLIAWMATHDFRGVIGGLSWVGAGVLFVSNARPHSFHSAQGSMILKQLDRLQSNLSEIRAEDLDAAKINSQFGCLLPWTISLDCEAQLASAVDEQLRRMGQWNNESELTLPWVLGTRHQSMNTAANITNVLATSINHKGMSPSHKPRTRSHTGRPTSR